MKYLKVIYAALFAYFLLSASPEFAQFEVSPDHFDQPATRQQEYDFSKEAAESNQPGSQQHHEEAVGGRHGEAFAANKRSE